MWYSLKKLISFAAKEFMSDKKKLSPILIMAVLSLFYFVVLIFPNMQGAEDEMMLAVFDIDEFAQYSHAVEMLSPFENLGGLIRNFVIYDHYFYGYPFYFFSGLSLIPIRLVQGSGWMSSTTLIVTTLRQLVNVIPNLISIWLLTYVGTNYKYFWKTVGLFTFLLISPALMMNSLWWHPDGLGLMFASLTMFFLTLDKLNFKTFYWLAAVSTGIAFGIKYTGAFFVLVIPLYILLGMIEKKIDWKKALLFAAGFVALMAASFVLSNPLLLTPIRSTVIDNQILQFDQTTSGIFVRSDGFLVNGRFPAWFIPLYGKPLLFVLLLVGIGFSLWKKETRGKVVLLLAWVIPYSYVVFTSSAQRSHYWLPIMLPAYLVMLSLVPESFSKLKERWQRSLTVVVLLSIAAQSILFLVEDVRQYSEALHKEESSVELQFSAYVKEEIVHPAYADEQLLLYRDWHIYYPDDEVATTMMDWELADYSLVRENQPDFLLLERANVVTYGDPEYLATSPDAERTLRMHAFYADALNDSIDGYSLIYEDDFGVVYQRID